MTEAAQNRRINYCFVDDDGVPRVVVVIMLKKGNLYFVDVSQPWKKSYHSPRDGRAQVHLKINGKMYDAPSHEVPMEEIKDFRMMGGSGMELSRLKELPEAKSSPKNENYILDTRPFHISHISKVQWDHYLVEPNNETKLDALFRKYDENNTHKMSERVAIHKITDMNPWIVTMFTRICDENPIWFQD